MAAEIKNRIREEAISLGFTSIGFSRAEKLETESKRLESWLKKGMHGEMKWMENWFDKRTDPRLLVPGARTVISLSTNYFQQENQQAGSPRVAMYARGKDYHEVLKKKLNLLIGLIKKEAGEISARGFVDSGPVMEHAWAARSGIGWLGKNANIISQNAGSFFFLSEIITDLDIEPDSPATDHCGSCTKCIDACPTDAIVEPYVVDGSKCISYFTIELKANEIPAEMNGKFGDWIFGCDICQDVCPWNRFSIPTTEKDFFPSIEFIEMKKADWKNMTEEKFKEKFSDTPLMRTKWKGIQRNLKFIGTH